MTKRRRLVSMIGTGIVLVLLAAACSSGRGGDAQGEPSPGSTTGGSTSFGDLQSPCGPGTGGDTATGDQGVTADSVTIGYGDDAGYQAQPGFNHEMSDAVKAMIEWCNDQGGINGRKVVGNYYDAKITEANNAMTQACASVFMLVGEGFGLDGAAEQTRLGCGLPAVPGYTGSAAFAMAPLMHQAVPNPIDYQTTQAAWALAEAFPDKVKAAATVIPNGIPASVDAGDKMRASYPSAGFKFIGCDQLYSIAGEADWRPFAQRLKDCGAQAVYFNGGESNFENLLDASKQLGFEPIWMVEPVYYTETFRAWNASGNADNVYVRNSFVPLEDAAPGSATAAYVDIVTSHGGDISELGAQSTSSFLLWATAASACGSDLTRDCVMGQLAQIHEWTGGGLHVPTDPGANKPSECGNVLKLDGTKWTVWSPKEGTQDCNQKFLFKIETPIPGAAPLQLNSDRIAQQFQSQG